MPLGPKGGWRTLQHHGTKGCVRLAFTELVLVQRIHSTPQGLANTLEVRKPLVKTRYDPSLTRVWAVGSCQKGNGENAMVSWCVEQQGHGSPWLPWWVVWVEFPVREPKLEDP